MLNNSQKEAVKMALTVCLSKEPNVGFIIGPPGTGKTSVICNIVLMLMSELKIKNNSKPKLLVCAPSNEAVDALVRRLIEIKKDLKGKFPLSFIYKIKMYLCFCLIDLAELQFSMVRVAGGQKYDAHSPIAEVMLDTLVKQRMNNPLSDADVSFTNKNELLFMLKLKLNKLLIALEII